MSEYTRRDVANLCRELGLTDKQKAIAVAVLVDGHSGPVVADAHNCVHQYVYKIANQVRQFAKRDPNDLITKRILAILVEYEKDFPEAVDKVRRKLVRAGLLQAQ